MPTSFTDQMGRSIEVPLPPQRIVSLVPSQTELLIHLGLTEQLVGRTKFCIHPKHIVQQIPKVGGTKQLHIDRIDALQPDLIIGNKEENSQDIIEQLARRYPIWMSDISSILEAFQMIEAIGLLTDRLTTAEQLLNILKSEFDRLPGYPKTASSGIRVAYLIWRKPYMVAAAGTFIDSMLTAAGFQNVFADQERYPEIEPSTLITKEVQAVFLSSEPYPFKARHQKELEQICPNAVIQLVDGELFSWYGSRMLHAVPYLLKLRNNTGSLFRR